MLKPLVMLNLSKEKLLIITALSLAGVSLTTSIVLGFQVIKLKQDLASQSFPTLIPTLTPTLKAGLSPAPSPKLSPTWSQSCTSENDCPKQMCQPPDQPCAQYSCIQGKCQQVYPNYSEPLNKRIPLSLGQTVGIKNTSLSLTLLRITFSQENCYSCPVDTEVEIKSGGRIESIIFQTPGIATKEWGTHRVKEVFGFQIRLESVQPELVILSVQKL